MENRKYYYLISGLPDIVLDQSKASFSLPELLLELKASLHPDDFSLVEMILLVHDNRNLLRSIRKEDSPWDPLGNYEREEMEEKLKEAGSLPSYMYSFLEAYREEDPLWPGLSWENQLTRLYYEYLLARTDGFLHDWFTFEKKLKNVLVAWNARAYDLSPEGQLVGADEVTQALEKSHLQDFGLSRSQWFVDKLLHALERTDIMEREKAVDRIRWNYIEELNTFHYFSVEAVLGYVLKFLLLDRWVQLETDQGAQALSDWMEAQANSVEFTNRLS